MNECAFECECKGEKHRNGEKPKQAKRESIGGDPHNSRSYLDPLCEYSADAVDNVELW